MSKPKYRINRATAEYNARCCLECVPEQVYLKIQKASKNGWGSICIDDDLKPNQKSELLEMGFKLREGNGHLEVIWYD